MLETALIAAGVAVLASAAVNFLSTWETRIRVRRLEISLAEWEERLVKEVKQRAAAASVASRKLPNPVDEALMRRTLNQEQVEVEEPWWSGLVKSK